MEIWVHELTSALAEGQLHTSSTEPKFSIEQGAGWAQSWSEQVKTKVLWLYWEWNGMAFQPIANWYIN
jgi:hypothetical protein